MQGLIALIKDLEPNAEITSLSQFARRDEEWFGIRFLPFSPYSTSPIDYLKLLKAARMADVILWGGGELLKDYTNKLSLFYWALKMFGVRLVNRRVIGAFQGIGPTAAKVSKWAIKTAVHQCRVFLVRDAESKEKLASWGVRTKIVASFDPAVYISHQSSAENYIGLGLRRWFHYRPSGWLPAKYRFWKPKNSEISQAEKTYIAELVEFADWLVDSYGVQIKFIPMHMSKSEDDAGFAEQIRAAMRHGDQAQILSSDDLSPTELLNQIGSCRVFVASRLHSAILATVASVPSICLYYVDKGRLFFEQVGLSRFSRSIDIMTTVGSHNELKSLTERLLAELSEVSGQQQRSLAEMRKVLREDLAAALAEVQK